MPNKKWVITTVLTEGRDDDLIEKMENPTINKSFIIREALRLYFNQESEIIDRLERIENSLETANLEQSARKPETASTGNAFLDSAL